MKIGVDIRAFASSPYGGVAEYGKNLLPPLLAQGHEHEFVLLANSHRDNLLPEWIAPYQPLVRRFHYPNKLLSASTRILNVPKLDRLAGGVDVWFSPHTLPAPTSEGVARVTTFHDLSFERFPHFFDARRRAWHAFVAPSRIARSSSRIIAVSEATRQDLIGLYGIAPQRVSVVYPGVPHRAPSTPPSSPRPYPYILSLCTLEPRKNIETLIEAFNRVAQHPVMSDHHLVIVGQRGWKWNSIDRAVVKSPYRDRIHFVGSVPDEEIASWYGGASLFVYPSFYEGFGFPPLEAMAHGVAVIASMTSSLPEVLGDAGILVDPHRVDTLASLLVEVLGDEDLRADVVQRGLARAGTFSWERAARETLFVLEEAFFHKEG